MTDLIIEAGEATESVLQYVLANLGDETLDEIEVIRSYKEDSGLANEPLTLAATLSLSIAAISAVTRLLERYMEYKHQQEVLSIIAERSVESDESGKLLSALATKYASVSVNFKPALPSWQKPGSKL